MIMGWSLDLFMTDWHWCFLTLFMLFSSTLHRFSSIDIVNHLGVGRDASFLPTRVLARNLLLGSGPNGAAINQMVQNHSLKA